MTKNFKMRIAIVELYESGKSPRDIAKLLHVNKMLVWGTLKNSKQCARVHFQGKMASFILIALISAFGPYCRTRSQLTIIRIGKL